MNGKNYKCVNCGKQFVKPQTFNLCNICKRRFEKSCFAKDEQPIIILRGAPPDNLFLVYKFYEVLNDFDEIEKE